VFSRLNFGGRVGPGDILLASVDGGEPRQVMRSQSQVVPLTGDVLLHVRDGVLLRQAIDTDRAALVGGPSPVAETVGTAMPIGYAAFAAAAHVIASSPSHLAEPWVLAWWTRAGVQQAAIGPPADYLSPRLSHDGLGLAVTRSESPFGQDVRRYDLLRGAATRLTTDPAFDSSPVWAPDGRRFTFSSMREGLDDLWLQSTDAAAVATRLHPGPSIPSDWSPDGRHVLFHPPGAAGTKVWGFDVYAVRLDDQPEGLPLVHTPFNEAQARFSPDGRFIAYMSDESGRLEVYVQPFPSDGQKWTVSVGGGQEPSWRRDGRELYYLSPDGTLMAVGVQTGRGFDAGTPALCSERRSRRSSSPIAAATTPRRTASGS
jgi:eukaryotic-like serine/threonine-protein kinase